MSETSGGGAPRDEGLVAFVEAIEAVLRTRRGKEHVLSPRDFALARGWYEAGIPLAAALVGIDLTLGADPAASTLAVCRRRVEDLAGGDRRPVSAARETERLTLPELGQRLSALRDRLQELPGRVVALPLQEVIEVEDLVAVASRPNWDYLRARLRRIDDLVAAIAVEALSRADLEALRAEASRAGERHRDRVDPHALQEALDRHLHQRARERLRLPRVGVDG